MISSKGLALVSRFAMVLALLLVLSYCVQVFVFSFSPAQNLLNASYAFNGLFALISFAFLKVVNHKNPSLTGFAFMTGSALKFFIFFVAFYPVYYSNGSISRMELFSFFIPYSISLIAELVFYSRN